MEAVVHEGRYMPDEKLAPLLETYDRQVAEFNRSRTGDRTDNDWAGHIADYHRHSMEHGIGEYLEKRSGWRSSVRSTVYKKETNSLPDLSKLSNMKLR